MDSFLQLSSLRMLDIIGALLGIVYIILEYRASIWLWLVSIIMPLVDMMLYFKAGLYADFAMAIYYALAAVYGYVMWKAPRLCSQKRSSRDKCEMNSAPLGGEGSPITHFPTRNILPVLMVFTLLWLLLWYFLSHFTNSTVPIRDAFTTALSMIALWALAHKYVEQWLLWLVVDVVSCWLYVQKGIPFKALLYGFYVVIAVLGYRKWKKMAE